MTLVARLHSAAACRIIPGMSRRDMQNNFRHIRHFYVLRFYVNDLLQRIRNCRKRLVGHLYWNGPESSYRILTSSTDVSSPSFTFGNCCFPAFSSLSKRFETTILKTTINCSSVRYTTNTAKTSYSVIDFLCTISDDCDFVSGSQANILEFHLR